MQCPYCGGHLRPFWWFSKKQQRVLFTCLVVQTCGTVLWFVITKRYLLPPNNLQPGAALDAWSRTAAWAVIVSGLAAVIGTFSIFYRPADRKAEDATLPGKQNI